MGNSLPLASSCRCEVAADVLNCTSTGTRGRPSPPVVKVAVSSTGEILEFNLYDDHDGDHQVEAPTMKAAELMLLHPHHFVCLYSSSLGIGQRASPLPSDQDLHPGRLYLLLPMHRLHSRLSHHDLAFLDNHASHDQGSLHHPKQYKLLSDYTITPMHNSLIMDKCQKEEREEDEEEEEEGTPLGPMQYSHGLPPISSTQALIDKWRSWRPNLQTINEKPPMRNCVF